MVAGSPQRQDIGHFQRQATLTGMLGTLLHPQSALCRTSQEVTNPHLLDSEVCLYES